MDADRIVVTRGHPTDAEIAAVALALARHRGRGAAHDAARGSAWILAARLEASGHPPIDSPMRLPHEAWSR